MIKYCGSDLLMIKLVSGMPHLSSNLKSGPDYSVFIIIIFFSVLRSP
jgi:hypothetical protein